MKTKKCICKEPPGDHENDKHIIICGHCGGIVEEDNGSIAAIGSFNNEHHNEFERLVRPVMKWLAEKEHPHTAIIIECNSAQLIEGVAAFTDDSYIVD